jgi:hypothetical protein
MDIIGLFAEPGGGPSTGRTKIEISIDSGLSDPNRRGIQARIDHGYFDSFSSDQSLSVSEFRRGKSPSLSDIRRRCGKRLVTRRTVISSQSQGAKDKIETAAAGVFRTAE